MSEPSIPLFSYGTLQREDVQLTTYGRRLDGEPDVLAGYGLELLPDRDPNAVRISGTATHLVARPTGNPADRVPGVVLLLTPEELDATDAYEGSDYGRTEVTLESGRRVPLYVEPDPGPSAS